MNIDDLRVILGQDGVYRRNISVNYLTETQYAIKFEYHIDDKEWLEDTISFSSDNVYQIIEQFNLRKCVFFTAYKKTSELSRPVKVFSGLVE